MIFSEEEFRADPVKCIRAAISDNSISNDCIIYICRDRTTACLTVADIIKTYAGSLYALEPVEIDKLLYIHVPLAVYSSIYEIITNEGNINFNPGIKLKQYWLSKGVRLHFYYKSQIVI